MATETKDFSDKSKGSHSRSASGLQKLEKAKRWIDSPLRASRS